MKHFCGLLVVAFTLTQFPCASHAQALRLQPLATFGPNGDGPPPYFAAEKRQKMDKEAETQVLRVRLAGTMLGKVEKRN